MSNRRFIPPSAEKSAQIYHCISRVVGRQFLFGEREKRMFVSMMRKYETFCDVKVLAFCVMSNHFHILLEVPPKVKGQPLQLTDEEFFRRIDALYSKDHRSCLASLIAQMREKGSHQAVEEIKSKYTYRMHDLSEFFKGLKQRFTRWYNGEHGQSGTIWESRFKSILVADTYAARVIAAYIDLNPVRAGVKKLPEQYPWSGYGQAMGAGPTRGILRAQQGIARLISLCLQTHQKNLNTNLKWGDSLPDSGATAENKPPPTVGEYYRVLLYEDGQESFTRITSLPGQRKLHRKGIDRKTVAQVLARRGKLSIGQALRCRVRYFTDGTAIGSATSIEKCFKEMRNRFGKRRQTGSRALKDIQWSDSETSLCSLRDLVKRRYT